MAIKIKSASDIADKWKRVTPERAKDYELGVKNPKKDWEEETATAEDRYEGGVKTAISEKRFGKGVRKAGTEKWKAGAVSKGVERFGPGVRAGGENYEKGFAPYREVLDGMELPVKYRKGDSRNYERVKAVGEALHEQKVKG